ncbi:MAG: hypothetical protein SF339_00850 [Blastocatellia bacterium]|nr:hypothetical protein [Blastocatellia bacterium]
MTNQPENQEPLQDETTSDISRRELARLLGAATALASTLGIVFEDVAAQVANVDQVKANLYLLPADGDEKKRVLLASVTLSPEAKAKLMAAPNATIQTQFIGVKDGKEQQLRFMDKSKGAGKTSAKVVEQLKQ